MSEPRLDYFSQPDIHGLSPHLFHQERLRRVESRLATDADLGTRGEMAAIVSRANQKLTPLDKECLRQLGVKGVQGLPLGDGQYERAYGLCLDDKGDVRGVAYPYAGKSVSLAEGNILEGRVYVTHDLKSVGHTKAVDSSYVLEQAQKDYPIAVEKAIDVGPGITAHEKARRAGVLTAEFLPPLVYLTYWFRNQLLKTDGQWLSLQRLWASNVRVNALFAAVKPTYVIPDDIANILRNVPLTLDVMRGRLAGFLSDAQTVETFNRRHGTRYRLGCSEYLAGDYTPEAYAEAFRIQQAQNLVGMVNGEVWHANLHPQNASISGELGDFDSFFYIAGDTYVDGRYVKPFTTEYTRDFIMAEGTYGCLLSLYTIQAIPTNVLGQDEDFFTAADFWGLTRGYLPSDSWAKNLQFEDLIRQRIETGPPPLRRLKVAHVKRSVYLDTEEMFLRLYNGMRQ